jgi:hypothetical protein
VQGEAEAEVAGAAGCVEAEVAESGQGACRRGEEEP